MANDAKTRELTETVAKSATEGPLAGLVTREHAIAAALSHFRAGAGITCFGTFNHKLAAEIIDAAFAAKEIK
jgi:hypothetical protein